MNINHSKLQQMCDDFEAILSNNYKNTEFEKRYEYTRLNDHKIYNRDKSALKSYRESYAKNIPKINEYNKQLQNNNI